MNFSGKPIICDVDLTFVDSGRPWTEWMEAVYGVAPDWSQTEPGELYHYNLSKYFPEPKVNQIPPYDYWEDPFLYDKMKPLPGAVEALYALKLAGHPIRFVSYCKKGHFGSKARFLKRETSHFLDLEHGTTGDGFYATKVKSGVAGAVIIDDRNEFLNQFGPEVIKIKFATPYTQSALPTCSYDLETCDWYEIRDFLLDIL